jgi:hypothetical protein
MFQPMRAANKAGVLGLLGALMIGCGLAGFAVPAGAKTRSPTRGQVRAAIHRATHSKLLWATIDSCGADHSQTVGIRGEMPALPFTAHLQMVVTVQEWSPSAHRYVTVKRRWKLGGDLFHGGTVVQNGLQLKWSGQVTMKASIDFRWFRGSRLIGSATRATTGGHAEADKSGYSAAACSIR